MSPQHRISRTFIFSLFLLISELVILLSLFVQDYRIGEPIVLTSAQFSPYEGTVTQSDSDIRLDGAENFSGMFAYSSPFELPAGSYRIDIDYEHTGSSLTFNFRGSNFLDGLQWDVVNLPADSTHYTAALWADHDFLDSYAPYIRFESSCGPDQYASIRSVTITPTHSYAFSNLISRAFFLLAADLLLLFVLKKRFCKAPTSRSRQWPLRLLLLVSITLVACTPQLCQCIFVGMDLTVHLNRIEGLALTLAGGQFPARLYTDIVAGRGYPFGIMYPDLLLYPAALLRLAGFTLENAYRFFVLYITALTSLITWYSLYRVTHNDPIALTGTALYVLSPDRLDLARSALGSFSARAFLPLIIYGLWNIFTTPSHDRRHKWCWAPLAIGFSGLLNTHILSLELGGLLAVAICLFYFRQTFTRMALTRIAKASVATILCNLWFLVPFLQFFKACAVGHSSANTTWFLSSGLSLANLLILFPVSGSYIPSGGNKRMEWTYFPGGLFILSIILCGFVLFSLKSEERKHLPLVHLCRGCLGFGCFTALLATEFFPWRTIFSILPSFANTLLAKMQFCARFLTFTPILFIFAACCAVALLRHQKSAIWTQVLCCLVLLSVIVSGSFLSSLCGNTSGTHIVSGASFSALSLSSQIGEGLEYLPATLSDSNSNLKTPYYPDGVTLTDYTNQHLHISFHAENQTAEETTVILPVYYYPGYDTTAPEVEIHDSNGWLSVTLPSQWNGTVEIAWSGFWYWHLFDFLSLFALLVLAVFFLRDHLPSISKKAL